MNRLNSFSEVHEEFIQMFVPGKLEMVGLGELERDGFGTVIDDLPTELVVKVLRDLDTDEDVKSASEVCQQWKLIVDNLIGYKVYIGLSSQFWLEKVSWTDFSNLSITPVRECILSDPSLLFEILPTFTLFRPHLLKILRVSGSFSFESLMSFAQSFPNLTTLDLHMSTFSSWSMLQNLVHLGRLPVKKVLLTSQGFDGNCGHIHNMITLHANLMKFLSFVTFSRLESFVWNLPLFWDHVDYAASKGIIEFVFRHATTLKQTRILYSQGWPIMINRNENFSVVSFNQNRYRNLPEFQNYYTNNYNYYDLNINLIPRLQTIDFECNNEHYVPLAASLVTVLLNVEEELRFVRFHVNELYNATRMLTFNPQSQLTLTSVDLQLDATSTCPIDLTIFSKCFNLQNLALSGGIQSRDFFMSSQPPAGENLVNGHLLPSSIRHLKVSHLCVSSDQAKIWGERLTRIANLHLDHLGQWTGYGLNLPSLLTLSSSSSYPRLKISVTKAINCDSCPNIKSLVDTLKSSPCISLPNSWVTRCIQLLSPQMTQSSIMSNVSNAFSLSSSRKRKINDLVERFVNDCNPDY